MNPVHAIAIAILQGATELFPVSSLGHAVIVPSLLGWTLNMHSATFLPFLVMLHLGTAAALFGFFWRDWISILRGLAGLGTPHDVSEARRVFWLIVVATIPVVIVGGLLEHLLRRVFSAPLIAAGFLILNGLFLLWGEALKRNQRSAKPLSTLTPRDALLIGCWQCLALIPGFSRSGVTIIGGLFRGLDHEESAHFSFLIALPVIVAAGVLEVPKLLHDKAAHGAMGLAALCAIVAGVTALASTAFLMRWFKGHERWATTPFAVYCLLAGLFSAGFLAFAG